jgi:anti-sigma B factor antagonist
VHDFQLLLNEPGSGVLELKVTGEIDMATVEPLREAAQTAAESGTYQCLVFDLSDLSFIDSTGLHALTEANRAMNARGGATKVVCGPGNLMKLFNITGLDRVFSIVHSRAEAIAIAA